MSDVGQSPLKFPDVRNFSDLVGHIVRLPFLACNIWISTVVYSLFFDADLYLVKRLMTGQSKMYWTAYQTLIFFVMF